MTVDAAQAWYVYCVLPAGSVDLPDEGVLPQAPVEAIGFGPVTVLASLVPRALFDRENAGNRTADPEWMAGRLEAHHAVNVAATATGPCLPLAFGALFSSLELLGNWIGPRSAPLLAALARVAGHAEWALSLQEDAAVHVAWLERHDPALTRLTAAAAAAGQGTAFLMARRLDKARAAARLARAATLGQSIARELTDAGFEILDEPHQSGLPSWTVLILAGAPTAPDQPDSLADLIRTLAAGMAQTGLSLRLSGPWPAYAFSRAALLEETTND